ncbi:MAG: butyrate kinase [Clostridiaceae bacterium]|nr:butyrate kinase [Clostridiaceae bacterium]
MLRLLVVNPGSTSTKFGVFEDSQAVFTETIRHGSEFDGLPDLTSQRPVREALICKELERQHINLASFDAVVGRGGLLHPLDGGVYEVNRDMIDDLSSCRYGTHASNLGGIIAATIAERCGLKAFIADPVIVDEMEPLARLSGWPGIERISIFHALNQKAVARRYAGEVHEPYEELNLVVAHMGGGISVGAHRKGRVIDVNNALGGDGPYSAERSGGLPLFSVMELCYSGSYSLEELKRSFVGQGGLAAYLGTSDAIAIGRRITGGDEYARIIFQGMAYQVAKEVGAAATVLEGDVDAVILTGGLAYDTWITEWVTRHVQFIAPVIVYPGEDELAALAEIVAGALTGLIPIRTYQRK